MNKGLNIEKLSKENENDLKLHEEIKTNGEIRVNWRKRVKSIEKRAKAANRRADSLQMEVNRLNLGLKREQEKEFNKGMRVAVIIMLALYLSYHFLRGFFGFSLF